MQKSIVRFCVYKTREKYFVVWLAERRFFEADSLVMQRNVVSEIAGLLLYVNDHLILEMYRTTE